MTSKFNIAIIGALSVIGRNIISYLAERQFPAQQIRALGAAKNLGHKISYGNEILEMEDISGFNFDPVTLLFIADNHGITQEQTQQILSSGAYIIDQVGILPVNESTLLIPEVNPQEVKHSTRFRNPHFCTIPIATVLKPIDNAFPIQSISASTYQSVSDLGKEGMDELYIQTKNKYMQGEAVTKIFNKPIAFNIIPQIGESDSHNNTNEEDRIRSELTKLLAKEIPINITCVRVPVFIGTAISLTLELEKPTSREEIEELLEEYEELSVISGAKNDITTLADIAGEDTVFVSRIRSNPRNPRMISLLIQIDNLRKGSSLNAVQIAELLL